MDHALPVSIVERERYLPGELDHHFYRELPLSQETIPQRFAADERHRVPELSGGVTGVVHRQDVGMLEPGSKLDLALEPLWAKCGSELGMENFESDPSCRRSWARNTVAMPPRPSSRSTR
jgi:hypothetical protein